MRRFIIAPDSFKGSMSAREICDILGKAVENIVPDADIIKIPMTAAWAWRRLWAMFLRTKLGLKWLPLPAISAE